MMSALALLKGYEAVVGWGGASGLLLNMYAQCREGLVLGVDAAMPWSTAVESEEMQANTEVVYYTCYRSRRNASHNRRTATSDVICIGYSGSRCDGSLSTSLGERRSCIFPELNHSDN